MSEAVILQTARKHHIGRRMGRVVIFSNTDVQRLYEALPCFNSSVVPSRPTGSSAGPSAAVRVEESAGTDNKKIAEEIRAKRESEIITEIVHGRRATAPFGQAALSYISRAAARAISSHQSPISGPWCSRASIRMQSRAAPASPTPTRQTPPSIGNSSRRYRRFSRTRQNADGVLDLSSNARHVGPGRIRWITSRRPTA